MKKVAKQRHVVYFSVVWFGGYVVISTVTILSTALGSALLMIIGMRGRVRGSTMLAPWMWSLFSLTVLALVELLLVIRDASDESSAAWRYAAAQSTHCPVMAVMGAKRPQDRGWQFIVLSLWCVLVLPAAQFIAFSPGAPFRPDFAWRVFSLVLITLGLANWILTRYWPSSLLFSLGQLCLLESSFTLATDARLPFAAALFAVATLLVMLGIPGAKPPQSPWDRWWLDFRDAFGAVWALRVAERLNAAARTYNWPYLVRWNGYQLRHAQEIDASFHKSEKVMLRNTRMLLRRFVSPAWIGARLHIDTEAM